MRTRLIFFSLFVFALLFTRQPTDECNPALSRSSCSASSICGGLTLTVSRTIMCMSTSGVDYALVVGRACVEGRTYSFYERFECCISWHEHN